MRKGYKFYSKECKECGIMFFTASKTGKKCWNCRGDRGNGRQYLRFMLKFFTKKELKVIK